MELQNAIKSRRSIRNFQDKPVEKELIEKLISSATYAPSACNIQGWKFIVVDKDDLKNKLVDQGGSIVIKNAPVGILVLYDNRTQDLDYYDYIQSAAAAIQNLNLTAVDLGLGTCWVSHLPKKKDIRKIFNIPKYFSPISYVLVGYAKNELQNMSRKYNLSEIINYNQFNPDWPVEKINISVIWLKRILIKIYYLVPNIIKKKILNKLLDKKFVKKFKN